MTEQLSSAPPKSLWQRIRLLPKQMQVAGIAAFVLFISMFLPWYQKSYFATTGRRTVAVTSNLNAFQVFDFIEAAVLLLAIGVLYLIWTRLEGHDFRLPGGDGLALLVVGSWTAVLLIWRLFDKPHVNDPAATVGVQWGIFVALVAAAVLISAGARLRTLPPRSP